MNLILRAGLILIATTLCACHIPQSLQKHNQSKAAVEFRLADSSPGEGLTEAHADKDKKDIYLHKEVLITTRDIVDARLTPPTNGAGVDVEVMFTKEAADRLSRATAQPVGPETNPPPRMAILIDGKVITAPVIRAQISDRVVITGFDSKEDAQRVVNALYKAD